MAKPIKLERKEVQQITKQLTAVAVEVHGYAYAAGALESLLTDALADMSAKDQSYLLGVVANVTQILAKRKGEGVSA